MAVLNLFCEVSDKIAPIESAWFAAIFWGVACAGTYVFNKRLALLPLLLGLAFVFVTIGDIFDPMLRSAMIQELGAGYVLQSEFLLFLPPVMVFSTAVIVKYYQRAKAMDRSR